MKDETVKISGTSSQSIGIVLVLFILLVIITSVSYASQKDNNDDSIGILTRTFSIYNNTSNYTLYATSVSSNASPISMPPDILVPIGGLNQYTVNVPGFSTGTRRAPIVYDVRDEANVSVGSVRFTLRIRNGRLSGVSSTIVDVSTDAPVNLNASGQTLTITNPILF
ncbi:hypothetical protein [Paenibacillus herberti]|uniref:Uncharacterized protein n=1 Tax=Paenibacillus herberti TaxID=1619309 RepID=A0A229P223_9BACL|nr:hypothetical protein [Paenibacillus herberti]OXM16091.1 hypothetical protein CGZ75_05155 [Paenibacillus herberti]